MSEETTPDYQHPRSVLLENSGYKLDQYSKMQRTMVKWGPLAEKIADDLAEAKIQVTTFVPTDSYDISFCGSKQTYVEFARIMGKHGLRAASHLPEQALPFWSTFWINEAGDYVIYSMFTSTVCKCVKVGSKTVEQDIYEVQCGE